ncbi:unnamed protein product [Pedinophyceae sp. YPF-701]|nr:unnamed protein product [Pedinophyceae sp. YPF-701]
MTSQAGSDASWEDQEDQGDGAWGQWEEGGEDGGDDGETQSLFTKGKVLPSIRAAIAHDAKENGFDIAQYVREKRLDEYEVIRLVNYIRSEVAAGRDPRPALAAVPAGAAVCAAPWGEDEYLIPVLPEDPLLFADLGQVLDERIPDGAHEVAGEDAASEVLRLREECKALREAVANLSASPLAVDATEDAGGSASPGAAGAGPSRPRGAMQTTAAARIDRAYFGSYAGFAIHREMLADKVRTEAYRAAIEGNGALFSGASVIDVGCGTGILSMFAARAGARHVVGIDGSERIAGFARQNAEANGLAASQGGPVAIVAGRVEQLKDLPGLSDTSKADVLISEWMGYALVFESMLATVLRARDAWLKPGGAILPDTAAILVAGGGSKSHGLDFWDDVYGFNMAPMRREEEAEGLGRTIVRVVDGLDIVTEAARVHEIDLCRAQNKDANFTATFRLPADSGAKGSQYVESIVLWFETAFSERFCKQKQVVLDTSPHEPPTHWAQTVLLLRERIELPPDGALAGTLSVAEDPGEARSLQIALQCGLEAAGPKQPQQVMSYKMSIVE